MKNVRNTAIAAVIAPVCMGVVGAPSVADAAVASCGHKTVKVQHPAEYKKTHVPPVYGTTTVIDSPAWTETVEHPAVTHEEQTLVSAAWDETISAAYGTRTVVDQEAWDEIVIDVPASTVTIVDIPAYDETVIDQAAVDRWYTWTGGPSDSHPFPSSDWNPDNGNHAGFPQDPGLYQRDKGHSGNSDWFYHEVVAEQSHVVHHDAVTHEETTPAVTHTVHHDAVTHEETYEISPEQTVHHDATYSTLTVIDQPAWVETIEHSAMTHQETTLESPGSVKTVLVYKAWTSTKQVRDDTQVCSSVLPNTGGPHWGLGAAGVALLVAGSGAVVASRRRSA